MRKTTKTTKRMPEWLAERHRQVKSTSEECVETEIGHLLMIDEKEYQENLAANGGQPPDTAE